MPTTRQFTLLLVFLLGAVLAGAEPDRADPRGLDLFRRDVRPVLEKKCLRCHGGKTVEAGLDLGDRAHLLKGGQSGPAVVPGKARASLLYQLVTHEKEPHMPHQAGKLPDAAVAALAAWIDAGAPYDAPLVTDRTQVVKWTDKRIAPEARHHWAFQPLRAPIPPVVRDAAWCRNPIDRFILAGLERASLTPNPEAAPRQLLRRAHLGLTGLPPTPEELETFLRENAAKPQAAYEAVIDRLLASPHFGERWARHWLDLARFAESHGFEHDYDRPTAWPYRDFVIRAFNADLPYDTFVKWQLAGDEYAPDEPLALFATGFLAAGVHSTQITKNEVEKHRYDELDDMLATTGTAFLGLTVGCARCHDHKFDPIPQADYYRLLATFTTAVRSEYEVPTDRAGDRRAREAFDAAHAPLTEAVRRFEAEQLPARLAAWEKQGGADLGKYPWRILEVTESKSAGGATFAKQPDGSLLLGGKNPDHDVWTLTARIPSGPVAAIRLEALSHPSLVKGGPGRAANGNFALTDFKATAADGSGPAVPLKFITARATFEQKGLPVAGAIDDNPMTAWAVDPQFGKDHAAVFTLAKPLDLPGGAVLTFTLQFKNNTGHGIGRPRLAVGADAAADLTAPGLPAAVTAALQAPAGQRTAEQRAALLQWHRTLDAEWQKLHRAEQEHLAKSLKPTTVKALITSEGLPPVRLHTQGEDFFPVTYFLRRGDPNQKEGPAAPGFLQALVPADGAAPWPAPPPTGWRTSYRRRALAEWLTDVDRGAGRLLARVIVNRLWQHHLGRGLVATPSDFGTRGEPPTHPELLDWLATELIRSGWSLKHVHRLILTSATYRQSSALDPARAAADPDNRLCWRRPARRLEAEAIRDALLAVTGELDRTPFGPGTLNEASRRRSVYFTVKRSKLVPMLQVFDCPDALSGMGQRPATTIAPQALLLLNNAQVRTWAHALARRLLGDGKVATAEVVRAAYVRALTREPGWDELAEGVRFMEDQAASYQAAGKGNGRELAVTDFCQALLCLNEFVFVE